MSINPQMVAMVHQNGLLKWFFESDKNDSHLISRSVTLNFQIISVMQSLDTGSIMICVCVYAMRH